MSVVPKVLERPFDRFQALRFPLILLVIYLHNKDLGANMAGARVEAAPSPVFVYIVEVLSNGVARIAVPLFFFMSGYLFFYLTNWNLSKAKSKLVSRAKSLLIPYVFWNVALFLALYGAQQIPATAAFFSKDKLSLEIGFRLFNTIFGITQYPIAYQFWFIRDLMVLVALSPIVFLLASRGGAWVAAVLAILWVVPLWPLHTPSVEATLFFYAGSWLAIQNRSAFLLDKGAWWLAVVSLASFAARPLLVDIGIARLAFIAGVLSGLVAALGISKTLVAHSRLFAALDFLASSSFFVFAIHEPVLTVLRKLAYRFAPQSEFAPLLIYLLLPMVVAALGVAIWLGLRALVPGPLRLLTGGR